MIKGYYKSIKMVHLMSMIKIRKCNKCGSEFESKIRGRYSCDACQRAYMLVYYAENKEKLNLMAKESYQENREQRMAKQRVYNRGISEEAFAKMLEKQNGRCAVCRTDVPGGKGGWKLDHDHSCCSGSRQCGNCARGILCHACNTGIGSLKDDPLLLAMAIEYLNAKHPAQKDGVFNDTAKWSLLRESNPCPLSTKQE